MDAASLNKMLYGAVRDAASRLPASNAEAHRARASKDRQTLEKCLGLHPQPPRTPLNPLITGGLQGDGYKVEKLLFESRPGVGVTAHLYLPTGAGEASYPLVLSTTEDGPDKKASPWVQARGVGFAMYGFAALIVDSPGGAGTETNERAALGDPADPLLRLGAPAMGQYVWDLMRALDFVDSRSDLDSRRIGITGGGASAYAFAMDDRIKAAAIVCWGGSLEHNAEPIGCDGVPSVLAIGDRSDVLAIRTPSPLLVMDLDDGGPDGPNQKLLEKLRAADRLFGQGERVRMELFEGGHDYNRRMRETACAFFLEHLQGADRKRYVPELRPLTDGALNPAEAGTFPVHAAELRVRTEPEPTGATFGTELERALAQPNPAPFEAEARLIPWGKHGRIEHIEPGDTLRIYDEDSEPPSADAKRLPFKGVDIDACACLGLSAAQFLAQMLHYRLPGRPEGWEPQSVGTGDALTSMIASVKTLVDKSAPPNSFKRLEASGPIASEVARHMKLLRPSLDVQVSHPRSSWQEQLESGLIELAQPLARYLEFDSITSRDGVPGPSTGSG